MRTGFTISFLLTLLVAAQVFAQDSAIDCAKAKIPADRNACNSDNNSCRRLAPLLKASSASSKSPTTHVERLAKRHPDILKIDTARNEWARQDILRHLSKQYRISKPLADALAAYDDDGLTYSFRRAGNGSLHAIETVQGSERCQSIVLFEATARHEAKLVVLPEYARYDDCPFGGAGEGYSSAWLGAVQGQMSFISEDTFSDQSRIYISPFINGAWTTTCQIDLIFPVKFKIEEKFCLGEKNCAHFGGHALQLADAFKKDKSLSPLLAAASEEMLREFRKMKSLAPNSDSDIEAPTFGKSALTTYDVFERGSIILPTMIDGRLYMARVGHAIFGWRKSDDVWVGFYELADERLQPVASMYLTPLQQSRPLIFVRDRIDPP